MTFVINEKTTLLNMIERVAIIDTKKIKFSFKFLFDGFVSIFVVILFQKFHVCQNWSIKEATIGVMR